MKLKIGNNIKKLGDAIKKKKKTLKNEIAFFSKHQAVQNCDKRNMRYRRFTAKLLYGSDFSLPKIHFPKYYYYLSLICQTVKRNCCF